MAILDFLNKDPKKDKTETPKKKSEVIVPVRKNPVKKKERTEKLDNTDAVMLKDSASWGAKVIKSPVISEKATRCVEEGKYVFMVRGVANKRQVQEAVSGMYQVKVQSVHMITVPAKNIRRGVYRGRKPGYKKAIVTLEKGQSIELT
jgi:large subunit ribosomal protein L23